MDSLILILQIGFEKQVMDKVQLLCGQKQAGTGRALQIGEVLIQRIGGSQHASGIVHKVFAVGSQFYTTGLADEDLDIILLLQTDNGFGQAGLADIQLASGFGDGTTFYNFQ